MEIVCSSCAKWREMNLKISRALRLPLPKLQSNIVILLLYWCICVQGGHKTGDVLQAFGVQPAWV